MEKPLGVFEPLDRRHRSTKFAALGVPVSYTDWAWLASPLFFAQALPLVWLMEEDKSPMHVLSKAWRMGSLMNLTNYLHSTGHILAGTLVGAPMDELIVTATRQVNVYRGDQAAYPTSTHVTRAAGGPLFNLLIAGLAYALYRALGEKPSWLGLLAGINLAAGLVALLPVESVDGGSIVSHLRDA